MDHWYESIQDSIPESGVTLPELVAQIIWECRMRGVHHAGQQDYIINKIVSAYAYTS